MVHPLRGRGHKSHQQLMVVQPLAARERGWELPVLDNPGHARVPLRQQLGKKELCQ